MSDGKNSNSLSLPLISLSQNPKSSLDDENVKNPKLLQSAAEAPQGIFN